MSLQAMAWAIEQQRVTDSGARHVLLCMANYANRVGQHVFPATATLARETGLSERTVRSKIDLLLQAGVIRLGNQAAAVVEIARADRRPVVYDLDMTDGVQDLHPASSRGAGIAPREAERGAADAGTGCKPRCERGAAAAPEPRARATKEQEQPQAGVRAQLLVLDDVPTPLGFADFWGAYPAGHKVARKACEAKWRSAHLDKLADVLVADVIKRAASDDAWLRGYVPNPLTYLNQERWNDDIRQAPTAHLEAPQSKTLGALHRLGELRDELADGRDTVRLPQAGLLESPGRTGD